MVWAASWRRRLKRRSTPCWMRRRAGWKTAATARVAAATTRLESWPRSWPSPEHDRGVAAGQQQREQPVGQRAADDAVQVVQPVAQDRRADRQRQQRHADAQSHPADDRRRGVRPPRRPGRPRRGGTDSAAANATQRSCWRSVPRARRKRTTNDRAPTARPPIAIGDEPPRCTAVTSGLASAGTAERVGRPDS